MNAVSVNRNSRRVRCGRGAARRGRRRQRSQRGYPMARGERGSSKPYLRGATWWIRYSLPGEGQRFESSGSTDKQVALRLLRQRLHQVDERRLAVGKPRIADLLELYLADQRRERSGMLTGEPRVTCACICCPPWARCWPRADQRADHPVRRREAQGGLCERQCPINS